MRDYIKCERIGGGSPRHSNTFLTRLFCCNLNTYQYMLVLLLLLTVPCTLRCPLQNIRTNHNLLVVDCTHVVSATTSFKDLVILYR